MKKTWFSCLLWFLYAIMTGILLATHTLRLLTGAWELNKYMAAGGLALCFVSIACICLAGRKLFIFLSRKISLDEHSRNMWECFLAMSGFAAALLYRSRYILHYMDAAEATEYYGMAQITGNGAIAGNIHGASYVYTVLLSAVLSFTGNKIMAGIVLQLVLQLIAMLFIYFAVRFMAGRVAALTVLGFMAFTTVFVSDIYRLEPQGLYLLLFAIGLWLTGLYLKGVCKQAYEHKACYVLLLLLGIYIGTVAYLDILGIALLLFVGTGFMHGERKTRKKGTTKAFSFPFGLQFAVVITGMLSVMALFIFLYAMNSGQPFFQVLTAWIGQYGMGADGGRFFYFFGMTPLEGFAISVPASFLVIGFWNNERQKSGVWMLLLLLFTAAYAGGAIKLEAGSFAVVLWGTLAGLGIRSIVVAEGPECAPECLAGEAAEETAAKTGTEAVRAAATEAAMETAAEVGMKAAAETTVSGKEEGKRIEMIRDITIEELDAEPKIRFIENPLPLPKKHVPREMDYGMELSEADMEFDVGVSEGDDFDI